MLTNALLYYFTVLHIFVRHPWADRNVTKRRFTVNSITFLSRAIFLLYSVTYIALQIDASKKSDIFSSNGFSSVPHTVCPCVISFRLCTWLILKVGLNLIGQVGSLRTRNLFHTPIFFSFIYHSSFRAYYTLKSFSWDNNGRSDLSSHLFL